MIIIALTGIFIAKSQGIPDRFYFLNKFAYNIINTSETSFHQTFREGKVMNEKSEVLFFGDSVLQQYIKPISNALELEYDKIDIITRGGCVLLKNIDFIDSISTMSCKKLRNELYDIKKKYKYVIFSQLWSSYDEKLVITDSKIENDQYYKFTKWNNSLIETIDHFVALGSQVILLGPHPLISGTEKIRPNLFLDKYNYKKDIKNLKIYNSNHKEIITDKLIKNIKNKIIFIDLFNLWCLDTCKLHNDEYSYYFDSKHFNSLGDQYVSDNFKKIFDSKFNY